MKAVMRITAMVVLCLVYSPSAVPQQNTTTSDPKAAQVQVSASAPKPPFGFGLVEDTPVRIRLA